MALCLVPALPLGLVRQDTVAARGVASWCSPRKKGQPSLMDGEKSLMPAGPEKVDNCDFFSFHSMH